MQGTKNESVIINKLYNCIYSFGKKIESIKGKRAEFVVLALYIIGHVVITCFHEPWYDEAEAWNIAKSGSLREIVMDVPHLEGHPALWYLILKLFIVLGISYEPALNICSLIFAGLAVYLILFRSPFPRAVRILLPFTYFVFYQYGVITRPYCVTLMAFMLAAVVYKDRNSRPWRYTFSLALICATSAYGLILSGGLAIAWVVELLRNNKLKDLLKNKCVYCLLGLFIYALFIIYRIIPENGEVLSQGFTNAVNGLWIRLVYSFLVIIPDLFFTNIFNEYGHLHDMSFEYVSFSVVALIGLIMLIGFVKYGLKKKTVLQFAIPYTLFSLFSGIVYLCNHHIGILFSLILFWLWISADNSCDICEADINKKISLLIIMICIVISVIWNIMSCYIEITDNYSSAKRVAEFLDENHLNSSNILFEWKGDKYGFKYSSLEVAFLPYRTDEKILNWPVDKNLFPFYLALETAEFKEKTLKLISDGSLPDVIVGDVDLLLLYGNRTANSDYVKVKKIDYTYTWKGTKNSFYTNIFANKDLNLSIVGEKSD